MRGNVQSDYLPDSPYPGIDPFGYKDRNVFFARAAEIQKLTRLIVLYRGVLLYSDSGVGKSSLTNAGIIPSALKEGYQAERIRVQPKRGEEIVIQLSEAVGDETIYYPSIFVAGKQQERVVFSVEEFLDRLREHAADTRPLLVFDQFEEWVTLFEEAKGGNDAADARRSQDAIRNAICCLINDNELPVKVLLSLREDYLAKLTPFFQQCPNLPDQYLRLVALKGNQIYQAIRGPFEKYPGKFKPEISQTLAKQIQEQFESRSSGADIRLTEVQIVCRSLFEAGDEDPSEIFVWEQGVQGILERYLEHSVNALKSEQQGPAIALLSRMVTSAGTRNVISQDDLCWRVESEDAIPRPLLDETLNSLEQKAKLVRREWRREVYYYEIASEFLVAWIRKKARQKSIEEVKIESAEKGALSYRQELLNRVPKLWTREGDDSPNKRDARVADPFVLVVVEGTDRRTVVLDHFPFTIGRKTDRDLVMADPRVAREQAELVRESDGAYVVDQGSRHGTFVNGERINRRKLVRNDRVEFGVQGSAYVLFSPDRSPDEAAQQFLSQFSTWKPASEVGSDLEMLNVFLEAARKLNTSSVLDDVLNTLIEAALRLTHAERGFVFLRQPDGALHLAAGRDNKGQRLDDDSNISRSVLREAAVSASEFLVTDIDEAGKLVGHEDVVAHDLHSVICIPLRKTSTADKANAGTILGVLYLDAHFLSGKLSSVSHDILRTIANGEATLVENAELVQAEDAAKRYRQELAIAGDIQQRLMTVSVPDVPYARVNAVSYPCKDIGGDFYDLVYTENGLSLIVADVSGKGVSAAVVASSLQAMLYSQLIRDAALPEMIGTANRFLCEKVGGQKYATVVIARLHKSGELELINCGHVPPMLVSGDRTTKFEVGNLPVGLVPGIEFQAERLRLKSGDRLLVVTDGVTEAEDAQGEFFGNDRLEACVRDGFAGIEQAVVNFRGETPLTDDCTITEMIYRG